MSLRIRRGGLGVAAPPPGGGATYGPTLGAASIRSGVGPRTVTDPGGGVSFNSSSSLQSAINAQPSGTTFVCSVNTPVWSGNVNTGTKQPNIIFPGPPGQKIVNGGGFEGTALTLTPGANVYGGTITNIGTATAGRGIVTGGGSIIEDVRVTDCFDVGISSQGPDDRISHCEIFANGIMGYAGVTNTRNLEISYCEIYGNNTRSVSPANEGGSGKISTAGTGWYHHNWAHDDRGVGPWWDFGLWDWLIEENVSENHYYCGLFWEANYGAVIRRNYIADNGRNITIGGWAPTANNNVNVRLASNKADVTNPDGVVTPVQFTRNIVDHTTAPVSGITGALILMWDHNDTATRHVANNDVFENQFWIRSAVTTPRIRNEDTVGSAYQLWNLDNNYFQNEYHVPAGQTGTAFWEWDTGSGQGAPKTYTQWQTFHPADNLPLQVI